MDLERTRQPLASERQRLERVLARRASSDDGEEADEQHASNLAADLHQEELDEGLSDDLRLRLAALERAERRLAAAPTAMCTGPHRAARALTSCPRACRAEPTVDT
jgi:hypothetical protein